MRFFHSLTVCVCACAAFLYFQYRYLFAEIQLSYQSITNFSKWRHGRISCVAWRALRAFLFLSHVVCVLRHRDAQTLRFTIYDIHSADKSISVLRYQDDQTLRFTIYDSSFYQQFN